VTGVDRSRGEVAVALALGCCALALAYASMRLLQAWRYPDPDPRVVLVTSRVAFYWRLLLAAHVGVLATIAARAAQARLGSHVDRALPWVLVATLVVGVAQGTLVP
jgi:hypothetical protein